MSFFKHKLILLNILILQGDEKLGSLKKLIHEELKEHIKCKANKSCPKQNTSYTKIKSICPKSHCIHEEKQVNQRNKSFHLKSATPNFIQRQNPNVIYSSAAHNCKTSFSTLSKSSLANSHLSKLNSNNLDDVICKLDCAAFNLGSRLRQTKSVDKINLLLNSHLFDSKSLAAAASLRGHSKTSKSFKIFFTLNVILFIKLIEIILFIDEPIIDYVKSAVDKQIKQNCSRFIPPFLQSSTNSSFAKTNRNSLFQGDCMKKNKFTSEPNIDTLSTVSVKEKILIFTNNKQDSTSHHAKSKNMTDATTNILKPKPLSQIVIRIDKLLKENSTEINRNLPTTETPDRLKQKLSEKKLDSRFYSTGILAVAGITPTFSTRNLPQAKELAKTSIDSLSVKEKIAYFSSNLNRNTQTNVENTKLQAINEEKGSYYASHHYLTNKGTPLKKQQNELLRANSTMGLIKINKANENRISSLIENLEAKWKLHGLNN